MKRSYLDNNDMHVYCPWKILNCILFSCWWWEYKLLLTIFFLYILFNYEKTAWRVGRPEQLDTIATCVSPFLVNPNCTVTRSLKLILAMNQKLHLLLLLGGHLVLGQEGCCAVKDVQGERNQQSKVWKPESWLAEILIYTHTHRWNYIHTHRWIYTIDDSIFNEYYSYS